MTTALLAVVTGTSWAHEAGPGAHVAQAPSAPTTREQTLTGDNPDTKFSLLRIGPGEPYVLRQDLGRADGTRARRRFSIAYFGQITDLQLADEESPARVEFTDADPSGFATSAWRPQEAFVPHMSDMSIRRLNRFLNSPIPQGDGRRARLMNAVLTGDLADNMQRNETEWVVRLLEGGVLDPSSGTTDLNGTVCPTGAGIPDFDNPRKYTGVQDYDDYFQNPQFYDPEDPQGVYLSRGWPSWSGLLDRAQEPFQAEGLKVPSYVLFGNHDALVQGNEDAVTAYEEVATGCIKPFTGPTTALGDALNPAFFQSIVDDPGKGMRVPPDVRRQFVDKVQFKGLHNTGRQPDAHGFRYVDGAQLAASAGAFSAYSFSPRRGVRFIMIDTLSEGGVVAESSDGNIDDPQWQWLQRELDAAQRRDEMVVAFGHHATGSLTANVPDEVAQRCTSGDEHGHDVNPGCDRDPRASTPVHLGPELTALFHRHPHVVAYVAGHSHENRIAPKPNGRGGGFWEIKTPAIVDWPPQHRLVEVMDNRDGTLSIFGTILDHEGSPAPPVGGNAGGFDAATLASVGRTLSFNDPQVGPGGPEGQPLDRNVELPLRDPRRDPLSADFRTRCANVRGSVKGRRFHRARIGSRRSTNARRYPTRRRRGAFDHFCLSDGSRIRVGYPTRRLNRGVNRRVRSRVRGKAILTLTNSRRFRKNRIRVGSSARTVRRRLRGERRVRSGRVTFYVGRGRSARPVFRVIRNRVREIGIASSTLTKSRRRTARFLRSYRR